MLDYAKIALLGLQIVKFFLDRAEENKQFDSGRQAEAHEALLALHKRTEQGRRLLEKVEKMNEEELDQLETDLVRGGSSSKPVA